MPTRTDLAKIHIAKKELKLTDELYRNLLFILFKKRSARDLISKETDELILHFKSLGWATTWPGLKNAPRLEKKYDDLGVRKSMASPVQLRLIEALWMTGPGVRVKTLQALRHFLTHFFHVSDLRFVKARQVTSILGAIRRIGCHASRSWPRKATISPL